MDSIRWAVRCRAHSSRTGQQCKRWSIRGGYCCPSHGGRSPQVRRAAERRLLEVAAHRTFAAYMRSPEYREWQDRAAEAADRPLLRAFADRLEAAS